MYMKILIRLFKYGLLLVVNWAVWFRLDFNSINLKLVAEIDARIGKAIAKIIWLQQILGIKLQSWTKPVETTLLSFTIFSNESFSSQKKKIHAPPLPVSMLFPRALSCIRKQHCTGRGRGDYCV